MKDQSTVIEEFNNIVNMTVSELETWLKSDDSQSAGWSKGDEGAESVGHESGRDIVSILKSNPDRDPEKYTEDHIQHMRNVVSYCKRHLAQEEKANSQKSTEEVKKTKSYASLKNWGHDILKKNKGGMETNGGDHGIKNGDGDQQTGDKRKADDKSTGANKKRETEKSRTSKDKNGGEKNGSGAEDKGSNESRDIRGESNGAAKKGRGKKEGDTAVGEEENDEEMEEDAEADDEGDEEEDGKELNQGKVDEEQEKEINKKKGNKDSEKPTKGPKPGDTVSWKWGNGQPEGKVLDVKGEKTTIETKNGKEVSRNGDAEDPAVVIDTGKSKAIKSAHELN